MRPRTQTAGHVPFVHLLIGVLLSGCVSTPPGVPSAPQEQRAFDSANGPYFPPTSRDYYPDKAKSQRIAGRVELECSVDANGRSRNIVVLQSGGALLDDAARNLLSDSQFAIPLDWSASGGPAQRFRYGIVFQLLGGPKVPLFEDTKRLVVITANPAR